MCAYLCMDEEEDICVPYEEEDTCVRTFAWMITQIGVSHRMCSL